MGIRSISFWRTRWSGVGNKLGKAIQFAYWALNDSYGALNGSTRTVRYASGSITTIAASVSNGGASLAAAGVIAGTDTVTQATNALALLHQNGYQTDSDLLHAPMWDSQAVPAVAMTYANAYARASVADNLCDFSFGTTSAAGAAGVTPAVSPMPPSQVIHTIPRGGVPGAAPALTTANLPAIAATPGVNAISATNGAVNVPN
nr:3-hydroxybutyrate oligomer hydrolase family protein [Paraburkholderia sp. UCT31]